ncbi:redoxin domain-containing protein [Arthrobacter sp. JSM 101049]|uniref:redoxin domain-containing protein n=1 Tax=Arthrobacter sp. JSM 101049 TaxID=929097 RepID=UPI003564DE7C
MPVPAHRLVGGPVPAFNLQNQFGETISAAGLGQGRHFLVFYPFAFSRVCTAELAVLERLRPELEEAGVGIHAVSVDHKFALRAYAAEQGIGFDLLADFWPHGAVARAFDCFDETQGRALRSTFLVAGGRVLHHFASDVGEARREQDYRAAVVQFPA